MLFRSRYPFSLKTPIGYSVVLLVQFIAFYILTQSCTCIMGLLIGLSSMIVSFIQDIKEDLKHLNEDQHNICKLVKLHSQAIQLS